MNKKVLEILESAGITFVTTFILVITFEIGQESFVFSQDSIVALVVSGLVASARAVARIVYDLVKALMKK